MDFNVSDTEIEELTESINNDQHVEDVEFEINDVDMVEEVFNVEDALEYQCEEIEIFENTTIDLFQKLMLSGLSRDSINNTCKSLVNLLDLSYCIINKKLSGDNSDVNACFRLLTDMIKDQSTDHKRKRRAKHSEFYVEPTPIVYGSKFVQVRRNNRPVHINKPLVMYAVPIKETL